MRIRMLTTAAGPEGIRHAGTIHTVGNREGQLSPGDAKAMIDGNFAVEVDEKGARIMPERRPSPKTPETATGKGQGGKGGEKPADVSKEK